ncbi:hypothetical protein ACFL5L_06565, partial [candidate division KSB1 bacterium]
MMKALLTVFAILISVSTASGQVLLDREWEDARDAWDSGQFITALEGFKTILSGPKSDRYFERIALLTGELYHVGEISPDGSNVKFSPDGAYASFEMSSMDGMATHIVSLESGFREVTVIEGTGMVFSPAGEKISFLRVRETSDVKKARDELANIMREQADNRQAISEKRSEVAWIEAQNTEIITRELRSGREARLNDDGLLKTSID